MFRSPLDVSSSSESDNDVERTESNDEATGSAEAIEREATNTESLATNGEYSVSENHDIEASQSNSSDHHARFLLAGLLEDYSRVRAAEMLNASTPGAAYTRHSPEIDRLSSQLFSRNSSILDRHNVLPAAFTRPDVQRTRSQYLSFLDLKVLQGSDMPDAQHLSNLLAADMVNLALGPTMSVPAPSPYQEMMLSTRSRPPLGRYHSEFQQVRLLGQGGYGRVFHVINAVDQQHYAIKRIPLSAKVYSRWLQGGDESARTFREIRTLAKLENPNIVRYYGAWVEAPSTTPQQDPPPASSGRPFSPKLLTDRAAHAEAPNHAKSRKTSIDHSDGIVFGEDTEPEGGDCENIARSVQHLIAEMPSRDPQTTSAYSLPDSEIFTDGHSRSIAPVKPLTDNMPVLCVQMSLHPMTLSTYLTAPRAASAQLQPLRAPPTRHCFHLVPSLRLLLGIIYGLRYLHALGIVHRDIKPGNILLSESPVAHHPTSGGGGGFSDVGSCPRCPQRAPYFLNPRIADFGLVAEIERATQQQQQQQQPPALPYRAAGTELYRPPASSAAVESVNEKLDVFALGILLFELLWAFGTKTERAVTLSGLQRGQVPESFAARMDVECGLGTGEKVVRCLQGMVHTSPGQRWGLDMVRRWAEGLLADLPGRRGDPAPAASAGVCT